MVVWRGVHWGYCWADLMAEKMVVEKVLQTVASSVVERVGRLDISWVVLMVEWSVVKMDEMKESVMVESLDY